MGVKITETITRECCDVRKDLKPVIGAGKINNTIPIVVYCVHCGARWYHRTVMDAAGSTDWEYRKEAVIADSVATIKA